jgi:endonuclease/exonuclease/phosphatase family metal-dependent hydrolase
MYKFSLLTLNTFGLPFILTWWRMLGLAHELTRLAPTIICLQEVQQKVYVPIFRRGLHDYPYLVLKGRGMMPKGGLLTASRCQIICARFYPFPNRGRWWGIGFFDWLLQKGFLLVELEVDGRKVIVINTHLHANYSGDWRPENWMARIQHEQVLYLTEFARILPKDALILMCGDFNFPRSTYLYDEFIEQSEFVDPLLNDPRPTYRPLPLFAANWDIPIDYIFYRPPDLVDLSVSSDVIQVEKSSAQNRLNRFLTDHRALMMHIDWEK